ncbi:MAG: PepSY domain-containing protein [Lautropia sp.]|nr:PepSY domain-containing protein [Lautropia sp.]
MSTTLRTTMLALLTAAGLGAGSLALAQQQQRIDEDGANLDKAGISLTEAIRIAEEHHKGSKAFQADFEYNRGQMHFDVDVITPQREVYDVRIDGRDGKVLDSRIDYDD